MRMPRSAARRLRPGHEIIFGQDFVLDVILGPARVGIVKTVTQKGGILVDVRATDGHLSECDHWVPYWVVFRKTNRRFEQRGGIWTLVRGRSPIFVEIEAPLIEDGSLTII